MKEKSLTTSLQSLHKRQSEYYVKLEKCLSEEKKNSQGIATNFLREYLVSLIDELVAGSSRRFKGRTVRKAN